MEISFILSADEIFTLMSLFPDHSEGGRRFAAEALQGASPCDLSELPVKKLAKLVGGELEIEPAVRMAIDAIARADSASMSEDVWDIRSPWVFLRCEKYLYKEGYWKITPVEEEEE
ncbi:MAG: hypothetical protein FWH57_02395 [Oscillospiraceae bacterium]|nr:hypothetical protein [Oscillospiraceae bacterium]